MSMTVKKGDNVVVITGKDKGKTGKVTEVSPKTGKVLVDGVNIVTKHQKARRQDEKSQIVKKNAPIEASNVMVVCPNCGKATRVAHGEVGGKKVRTCKKCSGALDKEFVKVAKKEAKKEVAKKETAVKAEPAKKETVKKEAATTKTASAKTTAPKKETTTAKKPASSTQKSKKTTSDKAE